MAKSRKKVDVSPFAMPANHSSEELLTLDADQQAASLNALGKAMGSLSWLHDLIKEGKVTKGARFNGLGVATSELQRVGNLLGKDEDDKQSEQLRKNHLRIANDEIARLRAEMTKGVTVEGMGNKLKELEQLIHYWWKSLGFLTAKGNFTPNWKGASYTGILSCYLDRHASIFMEDKPVSAKAMKQQTIDELAKHTDLLLEEGMDNYLLDTPRSRDYLLSAFANRFPGTDVWNFQSNMIPQHHGLYMIRELEVHIPIQSIEERS